LLPVVSDYVLWYAKNKEDVKYRQLFSDKRAGVGIREYQWVELPDGKRRKLTAEELENPESVPQGSRLFRQSDLTSQGWYEQRGFKYEFEGDVFSPGSGRHWSISKEGLNRMAELGRLVKRGTSLAFVRYLDDQPVFPISNNWADVAFSSRSEDKIYVVQTSEKGIIRCLLMTTDPGDLVFDPTCGSGTTAYVAEQWGRRWITCDTSRVALALARQRLMTATFPYYRLADESRGVAGGFVYKTVPHITLKSIANNEPPETETLYDQPEVERGKVRVSGPFTVEAIPPAYVEDETDDLTAESAKSAENDKEKNSASPASTAVQKPLLEADNHIPTLIELLRKDGVTFPNNRKMTFATLTPRSGGVLHAEGETAEFTAESAKSAENDKEKNSASSAVQKPLRVAVSFGPLYGQVTTRQVEDALNQAFRAGFDAVIFAGFAFDGAAQAAIDRNVHPRVKAFMAHIRPDVLMQVEEAEGKVNLLKTTASSQLFTVFGEPDVEVKKAEGRRQKADNGADEWVIVLKGVDIYSPLTGEVHSDHADKIAAWFIDTDYDGRTFCICQAFFPDKSAWEKLQRALRGSIDDEAFEKLTGKESLPFPAGEHKRAAVKVIDHRGNEVMKVVEL
jgi:adenine-specific DNA-methyltransferase